MVFGSVMINKGYSTLDDITNSNTKSTHYAIVVLKSSKINSLSELQNESIEYCLQYDKEKDIDKEKENTKESLTDVDFDFNAEKAWNDTFELYPKKSAAVMAKQVWMDKLLEVIPSNRKDIAILIAKATKEYLADYGERNPDDITFRYIPKYSDWLKNDCDYWILQAEKKQRQRGDDS